MRLGASVSCFLLAPVVWMGATGRGAGLTPDAPCTATLGGPVSYTVEFSVIVTPPAHTKRLRVWLPVPATTDTQSVADYRVETYPLEVKPEFAQDDTFGNTFAVLDIDEAQGAQIIRQSYKVTVHELRWDVRESEAASVTDWPSAFDLYLRSESQVAVGGVKALAADTVPKPEGIVPDMRRVIEWVLANMRYDHTQCSLKASSVWAAEQRCGHCSDYHGLSAALGRALGYPTRVVYGINSFPKNSPSHCKLEVFIPPYGWVAYDVSSTQKQVGAIRGAKDLPDEEKAQLVRRATDRLFAGYRDNTWIQLATGTDYVLPLGGPRVPLVRTAYIEADGQALADPDPGNETQREFAWMTAHRFTASRPVVDPFTDLSALRAWRRPR